MDRQKNSERNLSQKRKRPMTKRDRKFKQKGGFFFFLLLVGCLIGCSTSNESCLRIAATSVPHAEILEFIKPDLKKEGIDLDIIITDDYQLPNRLLDEKEVDANFFQHIPFLLSQKKLYDDRLVVLTAVHYEPLGIYSDKIDSLEKIKEGAKVAIPSDPSNEDRALLLLDCEGIIKLRKGSGLATPHDIAVNGKKLKFIEVDAPLLPRTLKDVEIAVIPSNFALAAGLNPCEALAQESGATDYQNVVVIRKGEEGRKDLQILKKYLNSEKVKEFILKRYKCAVQPSF